LKFLLSFSLFLSLPTSSSLLLPCLSSPFSSTSTLYLLFLLYFHLFSLFIFFINFIFYFSSSSFYS
jgi:hypothetical protein